MNTLKLFVSYTFLILTLIIYVVISSYMYQLELTKTELENQIDYLKENNDDISLEINIKNSRDSVLKDYPQLKFNNNIRNLERESE